jgi:CRISPR-associated protein Cas2
VEYLVVAYDVVKNRRRARLARALDACLRRVQKSVFEGALPHAELVRLRAAVQKEIDPSCDAVRLLRLCPRCREQVEHFGTSLPVPTTAQVVVVDG